MFLETVIQVIVNEGKHTLWSLKSHVRAHSVLLAVGLGPPLENQDTWLPP